jgi:hypothetical protein
MATLAEINQTLQMQVELMVQQGKSVEKTSKDIASVKEKIAQSLLQQKADRLDTIESKREAKSKKDKISAMPSGFLAGLGKGTGVSWLGDLIGGVFGSLLGKGGSLLGMLTGAIGLAAGKLLVWTAIGTLIANFFGDEIKAFAEKFKELTGIDINAELEKTGYKEEILLAATTAIGALTLGFTKLIAKLSARAVAALAVGGAGMLGFGPKATGGGRPPVGNNATGRPPVGNNAKPPRTITPAQRAAIAAMPDNKLPAGFIRNKAGKIVDAATGNYVSAADLVDAMESSEKASKYIKYAKLLKFLGAAGAVIPALADPAYAIYTEQSPEVIRKELIGALGSVSGAYLGALVGGAAGGAAGTAVPGIGNAVLGFGGALVGGIAGAVAGETIAEELANFLLGETSATGKPAMAPNRAEAYRLGQSAASAPSSTDVSKGDNPYANMSPDLNDPVTLASKMAAFDTYGIDRDRQRTSPAERGLYPSIAPTGDTMTQAAANARMSVMINNAPQITNITNNNGGGGNTSVMTVPVGTTDVSDRRDTIRRYGR